MRTSPVIPLVALLLVATTSAAQLPSAVTAGMRVRATIATNGLPTYTGTVLQIRGDSVVVRTGGTTDLVIFSTRDLTALDTSAGRPFSSWSAIKWSGIAGAVAGAFVALHRYDENECQPPTTACRDGDMAIGAAVGAAVGGAIGGLVSLVRGERWGAVALPSAPPPRGTAGDNGANTLH